MREGEKRIPNAYFLRIFPGTKCFLMNVHEEQAKIEQSEDVL